MKKLLFACFSLLILGTSCKKSGSGSGSGGTAFMTLTSGSSWNYKETNQLNSTSANYTLTATAKDSLVNGRTYRVFSVDRNGAKSSDYYNISGSTYYQFTSLSPLLPRFEYRYLVDNAPNWSDNINQNVSNEILSQIPNVPAGTTVSISAKVNNILEGSQLTQTVNGINYTDVKKVKTSLENIIVTIKINGFPLPNTIEQKKNEIISYYTPKKGLVQRDTKLQIAIQIDLSALGQTNPPPFNIINIDNKLELISSTVQ